MHRIKEIKPIQPARRGPRGAPPSMGAKVQVKEEILKETHRSVKKMIRKNK